MARGVCVYVSVYVSVCVLFLSACALTSVFAASNDLSWGRTKTSPMKHKNNSERKRPSSSTLLARIYTPVRSSRLHGSDGVHTSGVNEMVVGGWVRYVW